MMMKIKYLVILMVMLFACCQKDKEDITHPNISENIILTPVARPQNVIPLKQSAMLTCVEKEIPNHTKRMYLPSMTASTPNTYTPTLTHYRVFDYSVFQHFNNDLVATWNYINQLTMYCTAQALQDSIRVRYVNVLNTTPNNRYNQAQLSDMLDTFGIDMETLHPNADLMQLIQMQNNQGGISWIDGLCQAQYRYRCSVCYVYGDLSGMYTPLSDSTVRCWDVQATLHEQVGHGDGSNHTHDCVWNGNNTKIDDAPFYLGWAVQTCGTEPPPPIHGTEMGYWHLFASIGIDLRLGFGDQPKALIRSNIFGADACLAYHSSCSPVPLAGSIVVAKKLNANGYYDLTVTAIGIGSGALTYIWTSPYFHNQYWTDQSVTIGNFTAKTSFKVIIHSSDPCYTDAVVTISKP